MFAFRCIRVCVEFALKKVKVNTLERASYQPSRSEWCPTESCTVSREEFTTSFNHKYSASKKSMKTARRPQNCWIDHVLNNFLKHVIVIGLNRFYSNCYL